MTQAWPLIVGQHRRHPLPDPPDATGADIVVPALDTKLPGGHGAAIAAVIVTAAPSDWPMAASPASHAGPEKYHGLWLSPSWAHAFALKARVQLLATSARRQRPFKRRSGRTRGLETLFESRVSVMWPTRRRSPSTWRASALDIA